MAVKTQVNIEKELSVHGARVLVCKAGVWLRKARASASGASSIRRCRTSD